jgi:hypothetical protein
MTLAEADLTDIKDLTAGLERFIDSAILPLEEENAELLADKRGAFYTESGAYSPAVVELMRETRMRSAQAGYSAAAHLRVHLPALRASPDAAEGDHRPLGLRP